MELGTKIVRALRDSHIHNSEEALENTNFSTERLTFTRSQKLASITRVEVAVLNTEAYLKVAVNSGRGVTHNVSKNIYIKVRPSLLPFCTFTLV